MTDQPELIIPTTSPAPKTEPDHIPGRGNTLLIEVARFMAEVGGEFEAATADHISELVQVHHYAERTGTCDGCWDSQINEWPCWTWLGANELALAWLLERVKSGGDT